MELRASLIIIIVDPIFIHIIYPLRYFQPNSEIVVKEILKYLLIEMYHNWCHQFQTYQPLE